MGHPQYSALDVLFDDGHSQLFWHRELEEISGLRRGTLGRAMMGRRTRGGRLDDEIEARHREAWERYLEAERREVELRRDGHLAKLLGAPLPNESAADLERLAREDKERAEQGLVQLRRGDRVRWKHIDELTEEDRSARAEAERVLTRWLMDRQSRRQPPPGGSW